MGNEERTPVAEPYDKALMPASGVIVGKYTNYLACTLYLLPATPIAIDRNSNIAGSKAGGTHIAGVEMVPTEKRDGKKYSGDKFFHTISAFLSFPQVKCPQRERR